MQLNSQISFDNAQKYIIPKNQRHHDVGDQIINLYSQDEHRTLVDKRIITNLEKEIHFLKTKIETKNETVSNFIKNDSQEMRITMYLKMGKFGCLHAYQVTQIPMK